MFVIATILDIFVKLVFCLIHPGLTVADLFIVYVSRILELILKLRIVLLEASKELDLKGL